MEDEEVITISKGGMDYILTERRVRELTSKFIEICGEQAAYRNDFGQSLAFVKVLAEIKKTYWPATQKTLNAEVQDFDKQLDKWYELQNKLLEQNKNKKEIILVPNESV